MVKVAVEKLLLATFLSFSFENENSFIDFLCIQAASDVPSWYAGPIRPVEAFLQPLCTPGQLKKGLEQVCPSASILLPGGKVAFCSVTTVRSWRFVRAPLEEDLPNGRMLSSLNPPGSRFRVKDPAPPKRWEMWRHPEYYEKTVDNIQ